MKIQFKSAVLTALLLGSGFTQAATTTSSIPMAVEVPKSCTFSNVSAGIILPEDGSNGQGKFTITCRISSDYNLLVRFGSQQDGSSSQVVNADGIGLETSGSFMGYALPARMITPLITHQGKPRNYTVLARLKSPITAKTPRGVYTDIIHLDLTY